MTTKRPTRTTCRSSTRRCWQEINLTPQTGSSLLRCVQAIALHRMSMMKILEKPFIHLGKY